MIMTTTLVIYAYVLIFGLLIGSFLNVCIYRMPREESVVVAPSHCTGCGTRIKPYDLIPVLSFIILRGKCRSCGAKVSWRYPLIELLTGAVFCVLLYFFGLTADFAAMIFMMSILIATFFIDLEHQIIPDELVIAGLVGGAILFVYNIFYPVSYFGDRHWWNPLLGMVLGAGIVTLIIIIGAKFYGEDAMGGGDMKIFAPIGLFLGWKMTLIALFLSIVLGGVISGLLLLFKIRKGKDPIPFGPFIVLGTFITMLWGWDILLWYLSRSGLIG